MKISRLTVSNYKSFHSFVMPVKGDAFLVGPNNAGKSTLIEAVRACAGMARIAARRRPEFVRGVGTKRHWSYPLKADLLGMETENLRYRFQGHEARIRLTLDDGTRINAVWPELDERGDPAESAYFYIERKDEDGFRGVKPPTLTLPGSIGVLPTFSPIQAREEVNERDYVERSAGTPRTSQHLRNLVYHILEDGEFPEFRNWVLSELPELDYLSIAKREGERVGRYELDLFYRENRDHTDREICWAGDGIQIYLQILVHLWRLSDATVVVLDEPDVFLHADLQRRLVRLLEQKPYQTITATHSVEMLAEANEESVIWVDKSRPRAILRPEPGSMDDLSGQIGSHFNLRLATALKAKVVLFVEGDDMTILRRIANTIGAPQLSSESTCAVIPMKGYTNWEHIEPFQWFMKKFLHDAVNVFVILDRDYRTESEVSGVKALLSSSGVVCHVWKRKELESYLIEMGPLTRLTGVSRSEINSILDSVARDELLDCQGQFLAEYQKNEIESHVAQATGIQRSIAHFRPLFSDRKWLRERLPPKKLLAGLNRELQARGVKTVSAQKIARELTEREVNREMKEALRRVRASSI